MSQTKPSLIQLAQEAASDGQVITWDGGANNWIPADNFNGLYSGSGLISGTTIATLDTSALLGFAYDGGIRALEISDAAGEIILLPKTGTSKIGVYGSDQISIEATAGSIGIDAPTVVIGSSGDAQLWIGNNGFTSDLIMFGPSGYTAFHTRNQSGNNFTYNLPNTAASNNQVLTWNTGNNLNWTTLGPGGIYGGSGTIPGNVAATLQTSGSFKFEFFGGADAFVVDDATPSINIKAKSSEYGITVDNTKVLLFSDNGAAFLRLETTGGTTTNNPMLITTTGATIDTNAILDLASTSKLLYVPRMTTTQRDALTTPNDGGVLYNLTTDAFTVRANGAWVELGAGGGGISDGDKGDITVTASGATWTIDNSVVTLAKIANASANSKLLGAGSAGSGAAYSEITLGSDLTMTSTTLSVTQATTSLAGKIELATQGEVNVGTDTTRAVTPDTLSGSVYGSKIVTILVSDPLGSAITTGDGKAYLPINAYVAGMNLIDVQADVSTASTSGLPTIQLRRLRSGTPVDMLSTKVSIDANELSSTTATTVYVIDTANDDVAQGDGIYIDIDVSGVGAKGLAITLTFQTP